jgi:hypothetical protein
VTQKPKVLAGFAGLKIGEDFAGVELDGGTRAIRQVLDQPWVILGHSGELLFHKLDRGGIVVAQQFCQGFFIGYHLADQ